MVPSLFVFPFLYHIPPPHHPPNAAIFIWFSFSNNIRAPIAHSRINQFFFQAPLKKAGIELNASFLAPNTMNDGTVKELSFCLIFPAYNGKTHAQSWGIWVCAIESAFVIHVSVSALQTQAVMRQETSRVLVDAKGSDRQRVYAVLCAWWQTGL